MDLLAIIDDDVFKDSYLEIAKKVSPYADIIWYRIKNKDACEIFNRALSLRRLLSDAILILSERADIATLCGFNGVHLNSSCLPSYAIKKSFPSLTIGFSAHNLSQCNDPLCDYFTLSPIFFTIKKYPISPLGLIEAPQKNIYALGGVTINNYKPLKKLGYKGIAGISLCNEDLSLFKK